IATDILALVLAVFHLGVFQYLNGKAADGPDQIASQGYIATASNFLADAFGCAWRAALAVAFVQCLWHLLRTTTMESCHYNQNNSFQNRLAKQKLVAGESLVMASPGGVSCSYAVEFGGPYKSCNKATTNINPDHAHGLFEVYPGSWVAPFERALNPALYSNSHSTKARFNSTAIPPLQLHGSELNGPGNSSVILQQASASCGPGRAKNIMNNIYSNNLQTRNVTVEPIELLTNLVMRAEDEIVVFPAFRNNRRIKLGSMYTQPAPSTSPSKLGSQVSRERLFFIMLLVSLPFIVLGTLSSHKDGVSAMNGSFTRIITTSCGSSTLDTAAAGACWGGNESIPEELNNLEIQFGEFIDGKGPGKIKRAGFGIEEKVKALRKAPNMELRDGCKFVTKLDSIRHQDKTNAIVGLGGGILRALERLGYAQVAMGHTAWSRVQGYFGHVATTIGAQRSEVDTPSSQMLELATCRDREQNAVDFSICTREIRKHLQNSPPGTLERRGPN
ncbi:hypothetical protein JHW43_000491, partial [Diplocarpon mali]